MASGLFLILLGLFKKVAIADVMAPAVEAAFGAPRQASWLTLLVGVYAFALQIYGDFSGYTDIARGSARLLGIELMDNFPPALPVTGHHALHRIWRARVHDRPPSLAPRVRPDTREPVSVIDRRPLDGKRDAVGVIGTFHLVCLGWVFFRARSIGDVGDIVGGILTFRGSGVDTDSVVLLLLAAAAVLAIDITQRQSGDEAAWLRWPAAARGVVYGGMAIPILVFSGGTTVPFIYFQF